MKFLRSMALLATTFALAGCATLFSGTSDQVTFNSTPQGARVLIDGAEIGSTPLTTSVKRSIGGASVTYRLQGYETRSFELGQEFNMTVIWNIFCLPGFWVCGGIDVLSGAVMKYSPTNYNITLDQSMEEIEEELEVEEVYFEHELNDDVIGIRNDMSEVVRPNVAIVNSSTRQIVVFR